METEEVQLGNEKALQEIRPPVMKLTANEIRADINLIQEVFKAVMISDVHYGVIPGTKKPTLYKQGAEKIMATFRLNAEPLVEDLSSADEHRFRIRIRITHQITALELGWGVGECSSNEKKYKWIAPVCPEEFDETPEDRRMVKWTKGKDGAKPFKKNMIRAEIADVGNTILKMAKKRALVDAVLTVTAASDVFDQDIEDLPEGMINNVADGRPPMVQRASAKSTAPTPAPAATAPHVDPADDYETEDVPAPAQAAGTRKRINKRESSIMKSQFDSKCKVCGKTILTGEEFLYVRSGEDKGGYHDICAG